MSSPQMTRMLGFFPSWDRAAGLVAPPPGSIAWGPGESPCAHEAIPTAPSAIAIRAQLHAPPLPIMRTSRGLGFVKQSRPERSSSSKREKRSNPDVQEHVDDGRREAGISRPPSRPPINPYTGEDSALRAVRIAMVIPSSEWTLNTIERRLDAAIEWGRRPSATPWT